MQSWSRKKYANNILIPVDISSLYAKIHQRFSRHFALKVSELEGTVSEFASSSVQS